MANPPDIDIEIGRSEPPRGHGFRGSRADINSGGPATPPRLAPEGRAVVDPGVAGRPALPPADRVGDTVELVGRHAGRAYGYARSRTPAEMRADAEGVIVDNPVLALAAALGLGFVAGRLVRR